ncbi:50S ribosomal protein L29 [Candidatus Gracilibacteria bacterium]|nr:50S ribosomal protein L29 [Candidatus Gracilibacteria bacterium]NUJ98623.1 50S ribosomal protein L29 [Candidatus Gracilibacteria bacterium]
MKEIKDLKLKEMSKVLELAPEEIISEIKSSEKKMFELNMKLQVNELKQTHLLKALRRYIARLKTVAVNKGVNIC